MTELLKRVDDDWKRRAQQEKDVLAEKAKAAAAPGAPGDVKPAQAFMAVVQQLAQQAAYYLGAVDDPRMGPVQPDLQAAQAVIGMLEILQVRTKGNLAKEEAKFLQDAIAELQTAYAQVAPRPRK